MEISEFKKNISTINEFIYFDENDYLREKTNNPLKLKQFIADAKYLLSVNEAEKYYLCGIIGNLYRICEEPQNAINYLNQCLNFSLEEGNIKKEIVSLVRLGEALKYANKHNEALVLFNNALTKCEDNQVDIYLDFILQHKGKSLMELGQLEEAENCFIKTLKIRKIKGDSNLIESTQLALSLVRTLKNNNC